MAEEELLGGGSDIEGEDILFVPSSSICCGMLTEALRKTGARKADEVVS